MVFINGKFVSVFFFIVRLLVLMVIGLLLLSSGVVCVLDKFNMIFVVMVLSVSVFCNFIIFFLKGSLLFVLVICLVVDIVLGRICCCV